jgi:hypothetical protein
VLGVGHFGWIDLPAPGRRLAGETIGRQSNNNVSGVTV